MTIITIGIDLAKNIFAVHGVNENGRAELVKPKVSRDQLLRNRTPRFMRLEARVRALVYQARTTRSEGER